MSLGSLNKTLLTSESFTEYSRTSRFAFSKQRRARQSKTIPTLSRFIESTCTFKLEPWQEVICNRLALLPYQTGQRLLIHGPPQFGKSIIISQRYPSWKLGVKPLSRVRLACYNLTHAERFSKVNLSIMRGADFKGFFPSENCEVPEKCPADEWSTKARAKLLDANPSFKALGLGSGFTGLGVDDLIIDD